MRPMKTSTSVGGEKSDDYQNLLTAARKAVEFGFTVYMLPNPNKTRTPDFILLKKGVYHIRFKDGLWEIICW